MRRMKKIAGVLLALTLLTGCGGAGGSSDTAEKNAGGGTKSIRLVSGKIEIDAPLKEYAKAYEDKTGVKVTIESLGGGVDIASTIKGYLAAGNMPDLFVFGGEGEYTTWKDQFADLSNEPWVQDTDLAYRSPEGTVVGFPYAVEGYGLTYNKDLLDKAGIDPKSLVNIDAYKKAFETLDSMKDELGIVAVNSVAAESGQMYWSLGNHDFGTYLATGLEKDDTTYIDMLKEGKIDRDRMKQYGEFVKLLFDYSDKNVLLSGTYDDQLALWAQGKTVFVHQGNWIDPSLETYGVTFNVGMSPLAFDKKDTDGILADAPSWWGVYKDSKNLQEAKDFINSLASTPEGAECLVTKCGMISPFKSNTVKPSSPLALDLMNWVQEEKTYSWQWTKAPEGFALNVSGPVFESFARGDVDVDGFVDLMENAIGQIKK